MSLWSWVRALTEAKEKGMGHAPIACEWDHPSSEWAKGWGPYSLLDKNMVICADLFIYQHNPNSFPTLGREQLTKNFNEFSGIIITRFLWINTLLFMHNIGLE